MVEMIPLIMDMVQRPDTNKVMSTTSPEGKPHVIVCGSLLVPDSETIAVGEVYMYATIKNIESNPNVEFLVWSGKTGYAIKAVVKSRSESGPLLDKMNVYLSRMNMTAVAVWEFKVESVFDAGIGDTAGTKYL